MPHKPRNIIFLIADSLRFDSVYDTGIQLPYIQKNAIQFTEARSAGCWTLPATASLFTGLMPHEHGATSQSRAIHQHIPTLAEKMKSAGYNTYQVTANIATTDIFGLHRGFDEIRRIWKLVDPKFNRLQQLLVLIGKPRLRKKLMSKDLLMQRMSSDLEMAKTWLQNTYEDVFEEARKIIRKNEAKGESSFIFLNLMETHFPYHIAPTFQLTSNGIYRKLREVTSLYNLVNQSFLTKGKQNIKSDMLEVLKGRQRDAWCAIAGGVNDFCKEMHENTDNLVIFGADHGENFGETGWTYHFSNVTDAGNKVPMFWLDHNGESAKTVKETVSTRHIFNSLLRTTGQDQLGPSMIHEPEISNPVMQSFWYNNRGKTLDKYKYNQICFLLEDNRFLLRNNQWYKAPFQAAYDTPEYIALPPDAQPIHDLIQDLKMKDDYLTTLENFRLFSSGISFEVPSEH